LLSREVLEEIRLLGNLETTKSKLLQIALVGQPELEEKLDAPGLRQLKQRIALRCNLLPLSWEDTRKYVQWRLVRAGAGENCGIFPEDALRTVYCYSRGIPRLINTICENSLVCAYAAGAHSVSVGSVREVCEDLRLDADLQLVGREGLSLGLGEKLAITTMLRNWRKYPQ
jgi:general secretion pathway protein A